jgi:predicted Zn-dependent protease
MLAHELARTPRDRAMVEAILAQLASRQGRVDETFGWTREAEKIFPDHPALARARGEVLAMVWRFDAASPELWKAATATPRDDAVWSRLAVSLGSEGKMRDALDVARIGLGAQPRDPDCLRVQALALENLGAPAADIDVAKKAYFDRRTPDDAPRFKAMCSAKVPGCAIERDPVHGHAMRQY